jgi:drug/metabolite transporter (DMT)-like permease
VGAGVVVLKGRWQALIDMALVQGDLLMIVAVVLYALYSALLPKRPDMHPVSFMTYTFGLGCLGLLPLYLWEMSVLGTFTLTPGVAGSIGYVALFPSIVAYFCWNRGVAVIGANRTGLFINLIPVFAAMAWPFFSRGILKGLSPGGHGPDSGGVCHVQPLTVVL